MADRNSEPRAGMQAPEGTNRTGENSGGNVNVYQRPEAPFFQRHPIPIIVISLAVLVALVLLAVLVI